MSGFSTVVLCCDAVPLKNVLYSYLYLYVYLLFSTGRGTTQFDAALQEPANFDITSAESEETEETEENEESTESEEEDEEEVQYGELVFRTKPGRPGLPYGKMCLLCKYITQNHTCHFR